MVKVRVRVRRSSGPRELCTSIESLIYLYVQYFHHINLKPGDYLYDVKTLYLTTISLMSDSIYATAECIKAYYYYYYYYYGMISLGGGLHSLSAC